MLQYPTLENKTKGKSSYLNDNLYNLLDTTFQFPDKTYSYGVIEVEKDYIARPDLLSLDVYGDTMFADIICKINGISNPFEMNEGMIIVLPSYEDIMKFIAIPDPEESMLDEEESIYKPKPKRKNEKRKPNEAIIGDTRFKIDKGSKIIVY